jgi:hypothetical protein
VFPSRASRRNVRSITHKLFHRRHLHNGEIYLSKTDSVGILMTSHARINKAFEDLLVSDPSLEKGLDFNDFEDKRFYSLRGFEKICHLLGQELTLKDRREWCKELKLSVSVGD